MAAITSHAPPTSILRTKSESDAGGAGRDLHGRRNAICLPTLPGRLGRRNAICAALDSASVQCLAQFRLGRATSPHGFDRVAFDAFAWSEDGIHRCLTWLFCDSDLFRSYRFDADLVGAFVHQVRMGYGRYANPYHCFRHAFDVTQFCYLLLSAGDARRVLTQDEALGLVIAAVCHDLEHPGTDFAFQDAIRSHLSATYRGRESPLESHHLACALLILNDPETDILGRVPDARRRRVLDVVRECILATDMGRHQAILDNWRDRVGAAPVLERIRDDRDSVLRLLIKMADVSNVCRPWPVSVRWSQKLTDELMRVHDSVIGLGHAPNSFLSSVAADPDRVVASFARNVARPLLEVVVEILPSASSLLSVLDANTAQWNQARVPG